MFSKYFISTLVFIIVSLVVLFQGEIKEGFVAATKLPQPQGLWDSQFSQLPNSYARLPEDGMVPKPYFSAWQGNGGQFMGVELDPVFDKYGNPIAQVDRKLGYDIVKNDVAVPRVRASTPRTATPRTAMMPAQVKERFTPVSSFGTSDSVQIEAARNMQPLTGGPPRFNNNQSPHLNLTYPIDNEKYAVDPANPIVNYGCGKVYSAAGQLQKMPLDADQDVYEGYTGGRPASGRAVPSNMISLNGQAAQSVVIDRVAHPVLMVNSKSRLQLGGVDRIRGDVDVTPWLYMPDGSRRAEELGKHFQVSVKPHRDLVSGYIPQHNKRDQFFGAHIAASGIETDLMSAKIAGSPPVDYVGSLPTFGPDGRGPSVEAFDMRQSNNSSTMGRSNATSVRFGTDIDVGSYGI